MRWMRRQSGIYAQSVAAINIYTSIAGGKACMEYVGIAVSHLLNFDLQVSREDKIRVHDLVIILGSLAHQILISLCPSVAGQDTGLMLLDEFGLQGAPRGNDSCLDGKRKRQWSTDECSLQRYGKYDCDIEDSKRIDIIVILVASYQSHGC